LIVTQAELSNMLKGHARMKYANVKFDGNRTGAVNIGDDIQLVAIEYLYQYMNIDNKDIIRINLSELSSYDGEYVVLPISFPLFGYREGLYTTMFSPKIIPIFLGLSVMSANFPEEEIDYLKRFEPIGCRDKYTLDLLRDKNIIAYLNGCMTVTLPRTECERGGTIFLVDIPQKYFQYIPKDILDQAVYLSHILHDCNEPEKAAKEYLDRYCREAKFVVTTRLHCAWPCIASGIPVILMKEHFSFRFSTLEKYIHVYTEDEFSQIDWNPSDVLYEDEKKKILDNAVMQINNACEKYSSIFDISQYYENCKVDKVVYIEHFSNVVETIKKMWREDDHFKYAFWGVTQKTELIYEYISSYYKNSNLVAVFDKAKQVNFHGVQSSPNDEILLRDDVFVFVTAATANDPARKLFNSIGKENYHCSTDGIGE